MQGYYELTVTRIIIRSMVRVKGLPFSQLKLSSAFTRGSWRRCPILLTSPTSPTYISHDSPKVSTRPTGLREIGVPVPRLTTYSFVPLSSRSLFSPTQQHRNIRPTLSLQSRLVLALTLSQYSSNITASPIMALRIFGIASKALNHGAKMSRVGVAFARALLLGTILTQRRYARNIPPVTMPHRKRSMTFIAVVKLNRHIPRSLSEKVPVPEGQTAWLVTLYPRASAEQARGYAEVIEQDECNERLRQMAGELSKPLRNPESLLLVSRRHNMPHSVLRAADLLH